MNFLQSIKNVFSINKDIKINQEELLNYLQRSRQKLSYANDYINKFFEGVREFQPARRHIQLFNEEVKNKLLIIKSGISKGNAFLDNKMANSIDTMNTIRSMNQLSVLISEWIVCLKKDDENVQDLIKIVNIELWGEDRMKRGFPVPKNRDMLVSYLEGVVNVLKEAKQEIETYNMGLNSNIPQEKLENLE